MNHSHKILSYRHSNISINRRYYVKLDVKFSIKKFKINKYNFFKKITSSKIHKIKTEILL